MKEDFTLCLFQTFKSENYFSGRNNVSGENFKEKKLRSDGEKLRIIRWKFFTLNAIYFFSVE